MVQALFGKIPSGKINFCKINVGKIISGKIDFSKINLITLIPFGTIRCECGNCSTNCKYTKEEVARIMITPSPKNGPNRVSLDPLGVRKPRPLPSRYIRDFTS